MLLVVAPGVVRARLSSGLEGGDLAWLNIAWLGRTAGDSDVGYWNGAVGGDG